MCVSVLGDLLEARDRVQEAHAMRITCAFMKMCPADHLGSRQGEQPEATISWTPCEMVHGTRFGYDLGQPAFTKPMMHGLAYAGTGANSNADSNTDADADADADADTAAVLDRLPSESHALSPMSPTVCGAAVCQATRPREGAL